MKRIFYLYILPRTHLLIKLYWYIVRPKTTGVKVIIRQANEVLLIRNSYGLKLWTLPGGGVKRNEALEQAAIREAQEEVGIIIGNPKQHGSIFYDGEYKRNTIWVFTADVSSKTFLIDGLEVEEARWFPTDALPQRKSHLLSEFISMASQ